MSTTKNVLDLFYEAIDRPLEYLCVQEDSELTEANEVQRFTTNEEDLYISILKTLEQVECDSLVILENKTPIGIITEQDLLRKVPLGKLESQVRRGSDKDPLEMTARDLMSSPVMCVKASDSIKSAMKLMSLRKFRHLPVVDDNGDYIFTLDLKLIIFYILPLFKKHINKDLVIKEWNHVTVDEYDSILPNNFSFNEIAAHMELFFKVHLKRLIYNRPLVLDISSSVADAITMLGHRGRGALLVTQFETEMVGILTERDLLRKFFVRPELLDKAHELSVQTFMTVNPHMLLLKHTLGNALSNIQHFKYRNIILVDEDKLALSVIELMDIFKFILFHLVTSPEEEESL